MAVCLVLVGGRWYNLSLYCRRCVMYSVMLSCVNVVGGIWWIELRDCSGGIVWFFFKQKTAYEI